MNDQAIEQEIQAKGLTAPRVTPADIEANIASEHYVTAEEGFRGAEVRAACEAAQAGDTAAERREWADAPDPLWLLTFCVLVLRNGFTVTGESYCADAERFDAETGRNEARKDAVQKLWPLMVYHLKQNLAES